MAKALDITGERYERLTALCNTGRKELRNYIWRFRCDCGNEIEVASGQVRSGKTKSCGCLQKELAGQRLSKTAAKLNKARATHNHSRRNGGRPTPTYSTWVGMIQRCYNPNNDSYGDYGGRGITVCERWRNSFEAFLKDMGEKPPKAQIDRIENNGDYSPDNCRWSTPVENSNNRRSNCEVTLKGVTKNLKEWARELGVSHQVLRYRIAAGWSDDDILTTPVNHGNGWRLLFSD